MEESLASRILALRPDNVGAVTADRYSYQISWAICHLLELHHAGTDYLIALEYHDDILTLDSAINPTKVRFYQIKTRDAEYWRMSDLLRRREGKNGKLPSILGKLYQNRLNFPDDTETLMFVSNTRVKASLKIGAISTADRMRCTDIEAKELQKILKTLKEECGIDPQLDTTWLTVSEISLADHESHTRGKLSTFLERRRPEGKFRVGAIFAGIAGEFRRRNNCQGSMATMDDIGIRKGFTRDGFEALLKTMRVDVDYTKVWGEAAHRLATEHVDIKLVKRLRDRWDILDAERTNPENLTLQQLIRRVRNAVEAAKAATLTALMDYVLQHVRADGMLYKDDDVRTLALMEHYEPTELSTTNQGPPEATP